MEEAVVGSVISATIQIVLQNLLSVPLEELKLVRDFKKDLKKLEDSFLMIQDLLYDAEMQQVTNKAIKRWLKKLESVAFEADNVFDELSYHGLRNRMEKQSNMREKVQAFFTHSNPIAFRQKMAHKIRDINDKLKLINQEAMDFGLQTMKPVVAGVDDVLGCETDSYAANPIVLGREDDVSRIVEMLTASPTEQAFSVLPIVGMGGLGKTTLARQVFCHEKLKIQFDMQIWVYVSRTFDAVVIFKKILESLTTENNVEFGNREAVLRKIQKELGCKRYLLVLDDVWNERRERWDDFLNSLSGISSITGNGIIVTTRSENVASIVKTLPIYDLKSLSKDKCWSIIKAKAFREKEIPPEYEIIGRNIGERCQGLPLAATIVGGLLCDKSKDEWLTIEETWLSNFGEDANAIMKVLKFSFDHLSLPSLKKCFAYCSIFPKGFCIKREEMIELWMAEGFLTTDPTNDMEILGNKFFNILVQNSLLQVVARDNYGNITKCNMHDLVHDLASSILGSKSTCLNNKSLDGIYQVQYIAKSCPIPKDQARYVRTLLFESKFFDKMLLDFKSLHVLVLKCQDVKELPSLISELIHLRLVDISDTQIECLPDSIGKEKGCRIGELGSLKNLKGELEICNLERVNDKEEARSACLFEKKNIFKLKFEWKLSRKGERDDKNVLEGLQPHPNLKSLEIYGFKGSSFPLWTLRMEVRDDLEGRWIGLNNLMEIQLKSCRECEEIPMLGHLPHLKSLYLYDLTSVRSIGSSFYGIENCSTSSSNIVGNNTIVPFPDLEKLQLSEMPNLRDWVEIEIPTAVETQLHEVVLFPRLQYLKIKDCNKLTSAPTHFPCLKELTMWGIKSTSPLENMRANLISLTELRITQVTGLVSLPVALFSNSQILSKLFIWNCPNLTHLISSVRGGGVSIRELRICSCPNLRGLPNDLHNLSSLEVLAIIGCPNLKSIPYTSGGQSREGFTSLRHLIIEYCEGLTHLASEMIESCAPSLEHLSLVNLSSLTNLPMVIGCLQKMPLLRLLNIFNLPQITDSSTEIGCLHNLQKLWIGASSSYALEYTLFQEFLGRMFKGLQSLRKLELYGMGHWDSLPDQLQHLTTLTDLKFSGFGIEALPEWLGNVSSLKTIELYNCQSLRHLPSKEAMERLTKLTLLSIACCPRLNVQRCNEQQSDDSEWPKISHIPRVFVHGKQI